MKSNPLIKLRKGAWSPEEDNLLRRCIEKYGEGKWHLVPQRADLNRCRKSCRLRWLNYLRPSIKRGDFAEDEVDLIIRLHKLLGNRWSLIAGRLPGRTANDVKNYWNTNLQKNSSDVTSFHKSEELIKQKGENRNITTTTSTVVIKPLPRTLSKGTTVPCFSYHSSSVDNSSSAEENMTHNTNMVIDDDNNDKPQSPTARVPDQDCIEWWKKLLDGIGIGIGDGEEEEKEWSRDRDLLMLSSSTKSTGGVVEADGQNGWSDIWDILDADCHFN